MRAFYTVLILFGVFALSPKSVSGQDPDSIGGRSVEVGMKDLTDSGGNYEALETKTVCEWIRSNPIDLPRSIRSLMSAERDSDLLSSWTNMTVNDGRAFELLMMCKEELFELHIVMIEGTNLTYVVDRSFQGKNRKVRVGTVRLGDGKILSINSSERAASDARVQALFQVFLSWWENVSDLGLVGGFETLNDSNTSVSSTAGGRSIEVGLKNLTDFGGDYEALETKAVCEWMRSNPTDLPRAVQLLMTAEWDPDLLSSWEYVPLSDGREFDLLLMCKEELDELHIVLIEQNNLTYLVDRSLQGEDRKVRVGTVRLGNETILSINSTERAASATRNQALYRVFLSWWDSVKPEVQ